MVFVFVFVFVLVGITGDTGGLDFGLCLVLILDFGFWLVGWGWCLEGILDNGGLPYIYYV